MQPAMATVPRAKPNRTPRTVALIGDGSAMYAIQVAFSAAREQANVVW